MTNERDSANNIGLPKFNRRTFIFTAAATPLATGALAEAADPTKEKLVALITELENAPDYETVSMHNTKAFAAGEIRKALAMPVPDCANRDSYHAMCRVNFEAYQRCKKNLVGLRR